MTKDEIVGWHHRLYGYEFEQTLGDGEGQGSLVFCSPQDAKSRTRLKRLSSSRTTVHQASLSFTVSLSLLRLTYTESVMPSDHLILCHPLLLPSIFSSIRDFSNESVRLIRGPKYWGFSISLSNEYSGLISFKIGLFSLLSKGLSRVFSNPTVQKHQFFSTQPSL